jgi:hypothetical protein
MQPLSIMPPRLPEAERNTVFSLLVRTVFAGYSRGKRNPATRFTKNSGSFLRGFVRSQTQERVLTFGVSPSRHQAFPSRMSRKPPPLVSLRGGVFFT